MRFLRQVFSSLVLLSVGPIVNAQVATMPAAVLEQAPFIAAAFSEMFSDTRSFTARADVQFPGQARGETVPLALAMRDGKMRWQADLSQIKSGESLAAMAAPLKELKLDRIAAILEPDKNVILAFPGLQSWTEVALPRVAQVQEKAQEKIGRLEKVAVGRETVDGHPCIKYRLTSGGEKTSSEEAFVWQATDLKDLPIRLQIKNQSGVYGLQLRDVRYGEPDPRLFIAPANYTRHANLQALLQSALFKQLGGAGENAGPLGPRLDFKSLLEVD